MPCQETVSPLDATLPILLTSQYSALIGGGGAPEIHVSRLLAQYAQTLKGMDAYCIQAYAEALEVIPTTLAENAGLNPIAIVTELRNRHALGERNAGINIRKVSIEQILHVVTAHARFLGTNLEHFGGGRSAAVACINKCRGAGDRNCRSVTQD